MMKKQLIKILAILIFIISFMGLCDKKDDVDKLDIRFEKVIVNNAGEFTYKDSLIYIVNDTIQYELKFETGPEDVDLYYSKNMDDYNKLEEEWILIDSTFRFIRFYAQKQGYNVTDVYNIDFGYDNDSLISSVNLFPNPFVNILNYEFETKNIRGGYFYNIYDMTGKVILTDNGFVSEDNISNDIDLSELSSGIYLIQFNFGNTTLINTIIKQ